MATGVCRVVNALTVAGMVLWSCGMSSAAPLAYIPSAQAGVVTVIDLSTNAIVGTMSVGSGASSVAVNRNGTRIYLSSGPGLMVVDANSGSVVASVALAGSSMGIALNGSETRAYVVTRASAPPAHDHLSVIDTASNSVVATVIVGTNPISVALNGASTRAYVTNAGTSDVTVVDTATNTVLTTVAVGAEPVGMAAHPDGSRVYLASRGSGAVSAIDTTTNGVLFNVHVGGGPTGLAVSSDGTRLYVTNQWADAVSVIDTATNDVSLPINVGKSPTGIAVTQDGTRVVVANALADSVSVIDATTDKVVATIPVPAVPIAMGSFIGPAIAQSKVVEFYHAVLDHYFITWMPSEIAKLDAGTEIRGWARTGHSYKTYTTPQAGTSPVCRYYIPPGLGDSHFFGRGTVECDATGQKNPTFVLEDPAFMQTFLPAAGVCPANTTQVYRVFSNRLDANHRYMTDRTVRDQMVAKGWLAEGDGPDLVVMCAPQ
jgi:YVTN family beta-propeller protein